MIFYNYFVNKNENIKREYERYVMDHIDEHKKKRFAHWRVLWKLNWHYRIQKKTVPLIYSDDSNFSREKLKTVKYDNESQRIYSQKESVGVPVKVDPAKLPKGPYCNGPESTVVFRPEPYHFAVELLKYDVISFDIFDTLLLRPFASPTDVFTIVGKRLDFPAIFTAYKKARIEAEFEARNERERVFGTREINIYEIYEVLQQKIGIDAEKAIEMELQTEKDYLFANPYMQVVYNILRAHGKTIVLTSDMYIPGKYMEELVKKCGYNDYSKLYVSCDYRCNKRSGELFRRVIHDYPNKKIVHIGDSLSADIEGASKARIEARYYKNVNDAGKQFRGEWMSNLTGSAYNGIVNAYFHNGLNKYPFFYEYGFAYGGIYVFGFCQWIEKKCRQEGIEKIIFLARDGDIYQKIYNMFFGAVPSEYVYWSRFANMKYMIELQQDAFIDRVVKQKALSSLKIELASMLESFSISLPAEKMKKYGLYSNSVVNEENINSIKFCIKENWESICETYKEERELVAKEVKQLIGSAKKIAVIDVGWTGSGPLGFRAFVEEYVSEDCDVKCWMAGGAGSYGTGEYVLPYYMDGVVDAYLFSPFHNRRNESIHLNENIAANNNAMFEMFTQTQYPSYRGYTGEKYLFDIPEVENYEITAEIHKGIIDFCVLYSKIFEKDPYMYNISGFEAYRPFANLSFNKAYFEQNFKDIVFNYGISGDPKNQKIETVGERIKRINGGKK